MKKRKREIPDYDSEDTTSWIDRSRELSLKHLGFKLPPSPPTQVVSIRLPTQLLNQLRAAASSQDVPYQALIKLLLTQSLRRRLAV